MCHEHSFILVYTLVWEFSFLVMLNGKIPSFIVVNFVSNIGFTLCSFECLGRIMICGLRIFVYAILLEVFFGGKLQGFLLNFWNWIQNSHINFGITHYG